VIGVAAATWLFGCAPTSEHEPQVSGGDVRRGEAALHRHDCGVCHVIPGIPGAVGRVGPSLVEYSRFPYLAGKFPNQPELLMRFLVDAPSLVPETAMPAIAMNAQEARDIAAYLYELD
jgi:cytochrome c2